MIDSKLTFKIQEIPDGKSSRDIHLEADDLDFDELRLKQADVTIDFQKSQHFIKAGFTVRAVVVVTCDRSLEDFDMRIRGDYEVLFYPDEGTQSETEDGRIKHFNPHDLTLSLDQEVRDTVILELPVKKLHPRYLDEDGRPDDFVVRTFGDTEDHDAIVDSRWEALKKLKN